MGKTAGLPDATSKTLPLFLTIPHFPPETTWANCYEIPWRTNCFVRPLPVGMKPHQWERRRCQCAAFEEYRESRRMLLERIAQLSAQPPPGNWGFPWADRRIRMLREEVADLNWAMGQIARYLSKR